MDTKNINQSMEEAQRANVETRHANVETRHATSLQDAWRRYVDHSETFDDLNLIMDSIRKDEDLLESHEALNRKWNEILNRDTPFESGELKKYKRKLRRMYAGLKRRQKIRSVPSPTIVRFRKIWYAAAAALLLGLLIPAARLFVKPKTEQVAIQYIIEATQRGEIKTIVLPDQTKVTLNVESRLKYPDVFAGERSVELQGEAIFEVTPDSERPFTVATADMNVRVLGTVFDVKAYPDDELLMVSVASGKVEVGLRGEMGKTGKTGGNSYILLGKNHQVKIDKTTGKSEKLIIDAEEYLSWTDGTLLFHRTTVRDAVNMLNRYYTQLIFELAQGEYPDLITGEIDPKKVGMTLEPIFRSFGLKYKKTGNKILLYHENNNHK